MTKIEKVNHNDKKSLEIDYSRAAKAAIVLGGTALILGAALLGSAAKAQTIPGFANEFSRPYGLNPGDEVMPFDARTRDMNANRVVVDGIIMTGDNLSSLPLGVSQTSGSSSFSGTGYAIGNQLNVTTTGSFNTVIVNSSQINNGDQTVIINNGTSCTSPCSGIASNSATEILNGGLSF